MRTRTLGLAACLALGAWMGACGSDEAAPAPGSDDGGPGSFATPEDGGGDAAQAQTLHVEPAEATVDATGTLASVTGGTTFKAYLDDSKTPADVSWSLDDVAVGSIDPNGVFTAGPVASAATVTARIGDLTATAKVTVRLSIVEDPAGLSPSDESLLRAGGSADAAAFTWLYPYDKTVFPRGLLPPTLQLGGASPTALYVKVKAGDLSYEGFYAPSGGNGDAARLAVPAPLWRAITLSAKAGDSVTVDVTKLAGSAVTGPVRESWGIAQGSLRGTVYYGSYVSPDSYNGGAILRIKPGQTAEIYVDSARLGSAGEVADGGPTGCVACHSVNAKGTVFSAGVEYVDTDDAGVPVERALRSSVFDMTTVTSRSPVPKYTDLDGRKLSFGALSPDGDWIVGNAKYPNTDLAPRATGSFVDGYPTHLYSTATGEAAADQYFSSADHYAVTPAFSPDGKYLAFTNQTSESTAATLGLLSFDASTSPPTISGYETLTTGTATVLGWPTFSSDDRIIVYHEGDHFDSGGFQPEGTPLTPYKADLAWVDRVSKVAAKLSALDGLDAGGNCTLPYGDAEDCHLNYEPTFLPEPVGGYYWVVFTSRRSYGNTIYEGPNSLNASGDGAFDNDVDRGYRKKLWVAAIDIDGAPGTDISHPAFYLEGQELLSGNMRGFWALDPCKPDGQSCETGDECCGGFCRQAEDADGGAAQLCVPPPSGCANDSERCSVDADCCDAPTGAKCINHVCAIPTPPAPH